MTILKRFILILQFMTTIPVRVNLDAEAEDYGKGLLFAPLVGLVLGAILSSAYYALKTMFSSLVLAVLIIVFYIILTGGLHLDGLADTFDGVFSNRPREKILEIMKDSCHGTNALLVISSIILLYVSLLNAIIDQGAALKGLLLMPAAGRIGSLVGAGITNYARTGEGLGKAFIDFCGKKEMAIGLLLCSVLFYIIAGLNGLLIMLLCSLSAYLSAKYFGKKIGGATGDTLGAVCELNQAIFLILWYIVHN